MLDWLLVVICIFALGLVGCRGVDRLTGTEKEIQKNSPTATYSVRKQESNFVTDFGGVFTNDNFVELKGVPKEKYEDIDVIVIRDGIKIPVELYSEKREKEGHPYYMVSGEYGISEVKGLVFFNIEYGDEYQIFVYK